MIKLENICKKYRDKIVYNNLNLEINNNEILCILGASGSGKTTLLNILSGLTDYKGKITGSFDKISYIFQEDRLISNLTVKQNISYVTGTENGITEILKMVELSDSENLYPKQLSGGMSRRVSIARAFCYSSNLLLMDEPFSNLDIGLKLRLVKIFKTLWQNNKKTTVFVTHDLDEALMLSDRIILIDNGQIIEEMKLPPQMEREYGSYSDYKKQLLNKILKL
jgi:NitT/TauT family transport system ATP-binding protein